MYKIIRANERYRKDLNRLLRKYLWSALAKNEPVKDYWIVKDDKGKVIACCGLEFHNGNTILTSLVVEEKFRHRNIGSALIKHRLDVARKQRSRYAALVTMYYHFNFYKRRGFRTCPRADLPEELKDYWMFTTPRYKKCAVMYKPI